MVLKLIRQLKARPLILFSRNKHRKLVDKNVPLISKDVLIESYSIVRKVRFLHYYNSLPSDKLKGVRYFHWSTPLNADRSMDVYTPEFPESIAEGEAKWEKKLGDAVKAEEIVMEIETEKTALPVVSPADGVIVEQYVKTGDIVKKGAKLFKLEVSKDVAMPVAAPKPSSEEVKPDVSAPPTSAPPSPSAPPPSVWVLPPPPPGAKFKPIKPLDHKGEKKMVIGGTKEDKTPLTSRQQELMKSLSQGGWLLTCMNDVDMSSWLNFEKRIMKTFEKKYQVKMDYLTGFCQAAAYALIHQPLMNAKLVNDSVVYRNYIDMGVSVNTPAGVQFPVIRGVESLHYGKIANTIAQYRKTPKFDPKLLEGATFIVNDESDMPSMAGSSVPTNNQLGVLSLHGISNRAIIVRNDYEIRPVMYINLTYDHRAIEVTYAARFLSIIKKCIEEPFTLLSGI